MVIDTENLDTLKLHEVALLLLLYDKRLDQSRVVLEVKDEDIRQALKGLEEKGFITSVIYSTDYNYKPPYQRTAWSLIEKGKQALADNCVKDRKVNKALSERAVKARCDKLAPKLMELYPAGTKPGTSKKWRGNVDFVSEKLQKIILSGNEFTDEEAIAATKAYISDFNGMYTTMRTLPYFIAKNIIRGGEIEKTRDFLSYVEDLRSNPEQTSIKKDWDVELK